MRYQLAQSISIDEHDSLILGLTGTTNIETLCASLPSSMRECIIRLALPLQEKGQWIWQTEENGKSFLLYHLGDDDTWTHNTLRQCLIDIMPIVFQQQSKRLFIALPHIKTRTSDWQIKQTILQIDNLCYQMNEFKSVKKPKHHIESLAIFSPDASKTAHDQAVAMCDGVRFTRFLADLPANHCTPTRLAYYAESLAKQFPAIKTTILDKESIQQNKMGALLAVAQGSDEPPVFIEIVYQGAQTTEKPIVLIGKGITFDAGGISIKPSAGMEEMKYDMAGAASVLGTILACAQLKLPIQIIGLIPAAENLPSGRAIKPGDIISSMSGKTIEIVNTDAEGRLILADALTYAQRFEPEFVIDLATLTGAMIIALGHVTSGFMSTDETLSTMIMEAADASDDKTWRMPLDDAYQKALDSPMADMLNATFDRVAGSITAACFLARFAEGLRWAHLDIAGTAWVPGQKRQATGRPVPLLVELLCHAARSR